MILSCLLEFNGIAKLYLKCPNRLAFQEGGAGRVDSFRICSSLVQLGNLLF